MTVFDSNDQTRWNKLLLIAAGLFIAAGLCHNIMRANMSESSPMLIGLTGSIFLLFWMTVFVIAGCVGLDKNLSSFEVWGFVINRRLWISVALTLATIVLMVFRLPGDVLSLHPSVLMKTAGAMLEEVVFRGILLSALLSVVQPKSRWGVAGLICAVAALWCVVHIPTKSPVEIWGLFTSAIALGYILYYTRSLLFPIYSHVLANAGIFGAVIAIVCYFIVAGSVRFISRSKATVQVPAT
jgi:membrane protease YdiL (CAAX protease family)